MSTAVASGMKAEAAEQRDWAGIVEVLDLAFAPSKFESALIAALRQSRREVLEWVLRENGHVVAHVAFTKAYRDGSAIGFHLAPLAVDPKRQRQGLGTILVLQALQDPRLSNSPIFVLGDPRYYRRFGFERIANPSCPFDPGNQHFQAIRWALKDDFVVGYEPVFMA